MRNLCRLNAANDEIDRMHTPLKNDPLILQALHERATMAKMAKKRQQYHHPGGGDKRSNTVVTDKKGTAAVTVAETDMDVGQAGKTSAETGEKKVFVATCNGNLKAVSVGEK